MSDVDDGIRDIGYVKWNAQFSELEKMEGAVWNAVISDEAARWKKAVSAVSEDAVKYSHELEKSRKELAVYPFSVGLIQWGPGYRWKWLQDINKEHFVTDFDTFGNYVWETDDKDFQGKEAYTLRAYSLEGDKEKCKWTINNVGPSVIYYKNRIYFQGTHNIHWICSIYSVNAITGKDRKLVYKTDNPQFNLSLIKTGEYLYIQSTNFAISKLYKVDEHTLKVHTIDDKTESQIPYGSKWVSRQKGKDYYNIEGIPKSERPLWISPSGRFILTVTYAGLRKLWGLYEHSTHIYKVIWNLGNGVVTVNTKSSIPTINNVMVDIYLVNPHGQFYKKIIYNEKEGTYNTIKDIHYKTEFPSLKTTYNTTKSKDGIDVGYLTVFSKGLKKPKALLICGYGAYGSETYIKRQWSDWGPLLKRGWAIVHAFIRGGGDGSDEWTQQARTTGRYRSIDDFESVVQDARKKYGINAHNTVIYGRSAGGLLVGAMTSRWPRGDLFGAVYTEVPYVDVLRTTTNPALPLTRGEYEEFGNPIRRVEDMAALIKVSPVDTLPPEGASVFVVARTGEYDTQVFAYEPVKWILHLRGEGDGQGVPKLLGYLKDEGHFFSEPTATKARGEDLALLNAWVAEKISTKGIQMARERKTRHRKTRKSMEGGKRRKAGRKTARKGRKARKTARKH